MLTEVVLLPSSFSSSILLHPLYFFPFNSSQPSYPSSFQQSSFTSHTLSELTPPPSIPMLTPIHFQPAFSLPSRCLSAYVPRSNVQPIMVSSPLNHDLALGEAEDTEINQSGFSDTSWTDWAKVIKWPSAAHSSARHAERVYPQNVQDQSPALSKLGMAQQW